MSAITKLKDATDLSTFAEAIGYAPKGLSYILYKLPTDQKYQKFLIPKSHSGSDFGPPKTREIQAPCEELKKLQRRLAKELQEVFESTHEFKTYRKSLSHGYRKQHSIITNAYNHQKKRYVFNIDLKNFFPSINFGRVRGYFIKDKNFMLDPKVATIIAQIACHENELPQGSPASPIISNLIGHILDMKLVWLAKTSGCSYSRYVDDITFSTNQKEFPCLIADKLNGQELWEPSQQLVAKIESAGFEINKSKVSMQYRSSRQVTTGLVVNQKVNIQATYYRKARAMCNSIFSKGYFLTKPSAQTYEGTNEVSTLLPSSEQAFGTCEQLRGILTHIYNVKTWKAYVQKPRGKNKNKNKDKTKGITEMFSHPFEGSVKLSDFTGIRKLFHYFIYFEKFHSLERPIIICEGFTDIIHLKCAMEARCSEFPIFCSSKEKRKLNVDFFMYSELNKELTCLRGGTGGFKNFLQTYGKIMKKFKSNGKNHPVILLCDNDGGGEEVYKCVKNKELPALKDSDAPTGFITFDSL